MPPRSASMPLLWAPLPLPPQRDGSGSCSTSSSSDSRGGIAGGALTRRRIPLRAAICTPAPAQDEAAGRSSSPSSTPSSTSTSSLSVATISYAGSLIGAAYSALEHRTSLLQRGFMSLLQLLPRLFFCKQDFFPLASLAAGLFTFLSLSLPSVVLFSLVGLATITIYRLAAVSPVAVAVQAEDLAALLPPPPAATASTSLLQRRRQASMPSAPPPAAASSHHRSSFRSSRRCHTSPRLSSLESVPEAAPLALARRHRPSVDVQQPPLEIARSLSATSAAAAAAARSELLSADGQPVTDIQLAACVSILSAGLDSSPCSSTRLPCAPLLLLGAALASGGSSSASGSSNTSPSMPGGVTSPAACRPDRGGGAAAADDAEGSSAAEAVDGPIAVVVAAPAPQTYVGRAMEIGERLGPWVTVPVAVACVPVAIVCTLPVALPLLCTYGAVKLGYSAINLSAKAAYDCIPSFLTR